MFEKVLSCYKWVGTGGVYQRDRGELSEGLERLVRLEHLAVLIRNIARGTTDPGY